MSETFDLEVVQYGTSTVISLPKRVREKTGIKPGDHIRISIQRMKLVPIEEKKEGIPPAGKRPVTFRGKGKVVKHLEVSARS